LIKVPSAIGYKTTNEAYYQATNNLDPKGENCYHWYCKEVR